LRLSNGTFIGDGNRDIEFFGKALVIISENGPEYTTIDCQGAVWGGFIFRNGEGPQTIVSGITITNAPKYAIRIPDLEIIFPPTPYSDPCSPTIMNCVIEGNTCTPAVSISGYYDVLYHSPLFVDCIFRNNSGRAINTSYSSTTLLRCKFIENHVDYTVITIGTNDEITGEPVRVINCEFVGNSGDDLVYFAICDSALISGCKIYQNAVTIGVLCDRSSVELINCELSENGQDNYTDTALHLLDSDAKVVDCSFSRNYGTGIRCTEISGLPDYYTSLQLSGCTISRNTNGAIYMQNLDYLSLEKCNIAFNQGHHEENSAIHCGDPSTLLSISCCNIFGNSEGDWVDCIASYLGTNGNISSDPLFCGAASGDFRLSLGSPCLNAPGCGQIGMFSLAEYGGECNPLLGDDGHGGTGGIDQEFALPPIQNPGGCDPPFYGDCECDSPWFPICNLQHYCKCVRYFCPPYLDHVEYALDPATIANGVYFEGVVIPTGFEGIDILCESGAIYRDQPAGELLEFDPGVTKFFALDIPLVIDLDDFQGNEIPMGIWFNTREYGVNFRVRALPSDSTTGIGTINIPKPGLAMSAPWPNPVGRKVSFVVDSSENGQLDVRVYDVNGRVIRIIRVGHAFKGRHELEWDLRQEDGTQVASGIYFLVAENPSVRASRKIVIIR